MSSSELARRKLSELALDIETVLDSVADPVDRMLLADTVRADLAVYLTHSTRKSAWQARANNQWDRLVAHQWRGRRYLAKMAKQYAEDNSLPNTHVRDITSRHALDVTDLARLRGSRR